MDKHGQAATGYLLTVIAGWVDAQGFLALKGVFVSFMSGNTTLLGLAIAPGNWAQAGPIALVIGLFFAGAFGGAFLSGAGSRWSTAVVLAAVAAVLAGALAFVAVGQPTTGATVLALAMGMQNAAAGSIGPVRTGVTYVTGTLISAGQELGRLARGAGSRGLFAGHMASWLALLAGVTAGAAADAQVGLAALIVPCLTVAALAVRAGIAAARG